MRSAAARRRWAIVAVAVLIVSLAIRSAYYQLVLTQVLLWAVLSLAWNILSGYSGYFSFGHAAFWGLGAYTVSRVTGLGAAASEGAGAYGQIIVTLGLSLILQKGGLIDEAMHLHGHRSQFWARRRPAFARRCRAACCGRCCITMTKSIIPSVTDCELANRDRPQRR